MAWDRRDSGKSKVDTRMLLSLNYADKGPDGNGKHVWRGKGPRDRNVCTLAVNDKSVGKEQPQEEIRSVPFKERNPKRGPILGAEHEAMLVRALRGSRDILVQGPKDKQSQQERQVALRKGHGCSSWGMASVIR
ncbi:hypothetical protein LIER_19798 [Lithospermum erythrorhizon]|uniref:Uncharacterized protein n=1 Tax=Lithospermum erythrorhizon TaxID=34254 RepID=A0AAV3QK00_LITER